MWGAALCLLAMMIHVCADVFMKYVFNSPIYGTAEVVARYYMLGAVFLPLPYVELRNGAISVDLFYRLFHRSVRFVVILFAYLGQALFFSLLAYQSWFDAAKSYSIGEYLSAQVIVVVWPGTFFLPFGFSLAALVSILRIIQILGSEDWEKVVEYESNSEPDRPVQELG